MVRVDQQLMDHRSNVRYENYGAARVRPSMSTMLLFGEAVDEAKFEP